MKKSKLEAAETRRRIVKTAAAEFRRNGIHDTGLSGVMAAAGLTHGGFYRHFDSKDELVAEACAAAMEPAAENTVTSACYDAANDSLEAIVTSYLCPDHRDNLSEGCLIAALGSELARSDDKTRAAAERTPVAIAVSREDLSLVRDPANRSGSPLGNTRQTLS
jgi:TetR/AcrR family transcriptional regulator, transcriptional repressor for nem operon